MRTVCKALIAGCVLSAVVGQAHAAYVINIDQIAVPKSPSNFVGENVIASGSGSIDLTGLTLEIKDDSNAQEIYAPAASIHLGASVNSTYLGALGPANFGAKCGCELDTANVTSGLAVGVSAVGVALGIATSDYIFVPRNYISGTPLGVSTAEFDNTAYAGLGLIPGTYVYKWSSDTLTVNVDPPIPTGPSPVPLPPALQMFGSAVVALVGIGYGVKRMGATAA